MQGFGGKFVKGSEPAKVYWRRRAIVAGAALALILVVVFGLKAIGSNEASAEGQATAETEEEPDDWVEPSVDTTLQRPHVPSESEEEPSEAESPTEPAVAACDDEELLLQVVAAFDEARSGTDVPVSVLVASAADDACEAALGGVEVELAAGDDVVYASSHCEAPGDESVELEQGEGQTVEFTLDGLASDPGCEGDRRRLPAGDYEIRARLGEAVSQPTELTLT